MNLSNISSGPINYEDRQKNLNFIRMLYSLFAVELLVALIWTSFALAYYDPFGKGIERWWEFAIATGVICLILILLALFMPAFRKSPLNLVVYGVFTICFMHFISYVVLVDQSRLVYYALWLLFGIALGFAIYAWSTSTYMNTLFSLMVVAVSCMIIFIVFLIFTDVNFLGLLLVLLAMLVFGFYLNYDVRRMVRSGLYEYGNDDPFSGAVRIWAEAVMVFCRFVELLGRGCCKQKY